MFCKSVDFSHNILFHQDLLLLPPMLDTFSMWISQGRAENSQPLENTSLSAPEMFSSLRLRDTGVQHSSPGAEPRRAHGSLRGGATEDPSCEESLVRKALEALWFSKLAGIDSTKQEGELRHTRALNHSCWQNEQVLGVGPQRGPRPHQEAALCRIPVSGCLPCE